MGAIIPRFAYSIKPNIISKHNITVSFKTNPPTGQTSQTNSYMLTPNEPTPACGAYNSSTNPDYSVPSLYVTTTSADGSLISTIAGHISPGGGTWSSIAKLNYPTNPHALMGYTSCYKNMRCAFKLPCFNKCQFNFQIASRT